MLETVTVDEALKRGKRMITVPVLLLIIGLIFLTIFLYFQFFNNSPAILITGLVTSFILPWVYWSVMVTRWRIWAFENVRNVHELKKRAVKEQLIWKDGSFFEKTEIRSPADIQKLSSLQYKFDKPDLFIEDYTVPDQTEIHYSKNKTLGEVIVALFMVGVGAYLLTQPNMLLAVVIMVVGLIIMFFGIKKYRNREPQIIISNKGIQTTKIPFHPWSEIQNEDVIAVQSGKTRKYYFVYDNPSGNKRLDIAEFDTNRAKLEALLRVYRGRSEQSVTNH